MDNALHDLLSDLWDDVYATFEEYASLDSAVDEEDDDSGGDLIEAAADCSRSELVMEIGLTPRQFVGHLLDAHDGRLFQSDIVEAAGWSSSSVSRLLGEMEAEGEITRTRVGRQKVVFLPDHVPEAARHPMTRYTGKGQRTADWDGRVATGDDSDSGPEREANGSSSGDADSRQPSSG